VSGDRIFAGTDGDGIFQSIDNGASWNAVNSGISPGLTNSTVASLAVDGGIVFAGTGGGLYYRPLSELAGVIDSKPLRGTSHQARLDIHASGRTRPTATIEFSLPRSDRVTVGIYDLSGREIASLVNEYLVAGLYSIPWNTRTMASGHYPVRMQVGSDIFVKSVTIIR
jgi:hypothetical protein